MAWHPTLSSLERKTDLPQDRPRPLTGTQRREAALKPIGMWEDCWCGQPYQHSWPGKDTGVPHPRRAAGVALTFTAHNVVLPDGSQTLRGAGPVAGNGICKAALRDLELAFPGAPRESVRVADLGCLEGGYAAAFASAGYDVTGFEVRAENFMCCEYVAEQLALPNLRFIRADVRDAFTEPEQWDAVFCCGLLYHLENPVAFLNRLGQAVRRLLIVQSHYSVHPDAVHEGRRGHRLVADVIWLPAAADVLQPGLDADDDAVAVFPQSAVDLADDLAAAAAYGQLRRQLRGENVHGFHASW